MDEPQFLEYVRVLRRRKWWIVGGLVLGVIGSGAFAFTQTKEYQATATVLVTTVPSVSSAVPSGSVSPAQMATDAQLVTTPGVAKVASGILGYPAPKVSATASTTENVISVTASGPSPTADAKVANAYAVAFVRSQQHAAIQDGKAAASSITVQLNSLSSQIASLQTQLRKVSSASTQAGAIQAQISNLSGQEATLSGEKAQMLIAARLSANGVSMEEKAVPPPAPYSPNKKRDLLLGGLAGMILGLGLALSVDAIDDRIRTREEITRSYPNLPLLGMVPYVEQWRATADPYLVSLARPTSPASEAFRSVRTALQFVRIDRELKVIVVTSANPSEAKSSSVANLGVSIAKAGKSVCVVSADLRRPRLGSFLGCSDKVGLTSVVIGDATLDEALQPVEGAPGLFYIGTGQLPAEMAEFLGSQKVADLFGQLRERFDTVLIDTPPLLAVSDALVTTTYSDGVVLTIRHDSTRRRALVRMRELLEQSDAEVVGAILTESSSGSFNRYGDGYGYYGKYYARGDVRPTSARLLPRRLAARGHKKAASAAGGLAATSSLDGEGPQISRASS